MNRLLLSLVLALPAFGAAVIKTNPAPSYQPRLTWKVSSSANGLDGSTSTGITGYKWTCVSFDSGSGSGACPMGFAFSNDSIASPTVTLPSNQGDYAIKLCAADGTTGCTTEHIGARNIDANGVIIPADANITKIYGPMIAWGYNTLGANQDINALRASVDRKTDYDGRLPPTWDTALTGTISYPFIVQTGTTLNQGGGTLASTDLAITVADATQLDLSAFPALIAINLNRFGGMSPSFTYEIVEICSAAGNVLTVCFDGRGYRYGATGHAAASSWTNGVTITQHKIAGSSTTLLTTFNPLGAGWSGQTISTAGTCQVAHNDTHIIGTGTNWTTGANFGRAIRISGHHGGVAFTFFAYVGTVTDTTHLVTNRVFPNAGDDESGLTCSTFDPDTRFLAAHYGRCGAGSFTGCVDEAYPYDGTLLFSLDGCESDTACYVFGGRDPDSVSPGYGTCLSNPPYQNTVMECGKKLSYQDGLGTVNDGGLNFYDEVLANMAGWFRSGLIAFLNAARELGGVDGTNNIGTPFWPEIDQGTGGSPRDVSVAGMWAMYLFDGKTKNLQALRAFANQAVSKKSAFSSCDALDLREDVGYPLHWLALDAIFDPDSSIRTSMKAQLDDWLTVYSPCARTGSGVLANSWYTSILFDTSVGGANWNGPITTTVGSKIVTGTGIPAAVCGTTPATTGTATFTPGSDDVIGTGFITGGGRIVVVDSTLGNLAFGYTFISSTHITLSGKYPSTGAGGSGVVYGIDTESSDDQFGNAPFRGLLVIGTSVADDQIRKVQYCTWNNSGQITLLTNWDGTAGTNYAWRSGIHHYTSIGGRLTQPFFLNILSIGMRIASQAAGSTGTGFTTLLNNLTTWERNYGIDPTTNGAYYCRVGAGCEPVYAEATTPATLFRNLGASFSSATGGLQTSHDIAAEMQSIPYLSLSIDATAANLSFWQTWYTAMWADTTGAPSCNRGSWVGQPKYYGFCFGIGMSHQPPAAFFGVGSGGSRRGSTARSASTSRN